MSKTVLSAAFLGLLWTGFALGLADNLISDGRLEPTTANAEYLAVDQTGFRNCALIYYNPEYDAETFKPILVKYVDGKPTDQAGYDAFLFLYYSINGKPLEAAPTTKSEWLEFFDGWFTRQANGQPINVPALNQAVGDLKRQKNLPSAPDFRVPVIFSISWLNPEVTDFGDVNGDGKSEDLSKPEGRRTVLDWYMTEIVKRMKTHPNLRLWGFYMMREGLAPGIAQTIAREYCNAIHDKGYKALWIPYYGAGGIEESYDIGFDAVIMQSNWTFRTKTDGTGARRNQLIQAANYTRNHGCGIELEINPPAEPQWREIFKRTLETGTQTGFQKAASATYFGSKFYWGTSADPEDQKLYALWMDYLAGKPIQLPKTGTWKIVKTDAKDNRLIVQYDLNAPAPVSLLDVFLTETPDQFFSGTVEVFGRNTTALGKTYSSKTYSSKTYSDKTDSGKSGSSGADWTALGWTYRCSFNTKQESFQNITIQTLSQPVNQLRLRFTPFAGSSVGTIRGIEPDLWTPPINVSLAYRKPYQCSKRRVQADYPDSTGRELIDSTIDGDWSKYVGWHGNGRVHIALDLGSIQKFDTIRVYLREEPSAGIVLPNAQTVLFSLNPGQLSQFGLGALPPGYCASGAFRYVSAESVVPKGTNGQGPISNKVRLSELKFDKQAEARGLTLTFDHSGWLFLSEIELYRDGKKLDAADFSYTFTPQFEGNLKNNEKYCDNSLCLTDGYVGTDYSKNAVGVNGQEILTATVDLGAVVPIRRVVCAAIDGGGAGIVLPKSVAVRLSDDGKTWSAPYPVSVPESQKKSSNFSVSLSLDLPPEITGRFVEVVAVPRGWAFLSEIYVE